VVYSTSGGNLYLLNFNTFQRTSLIYSGFPQKLTKVCFFNDSHLYDIVASSSEGKIIFISSSCSI
jgi:hypothetical protein